MRHQKYEVNHTVIQKFTIRTVEKTSQNVYHIVNDAFHSVVLLYNNVQFSPHLLLLSHDNIVF